MFSARALAIACFLALPLSNVACSGADQGTPASEDDEIRRGGLVRQDLPAGTFKTRSEEIAQEWLDGNIMTGDPRLDSGKLRGTLTTSSLQKFAEKMVTDHLREQEEGTILPPTFASPNYTDALVKSVAKTVGVDGFVLNPTNPDNFTTLEENVKELLGFLGDKSKVDVLTLEAKIKNPSDDYHDEVSLFVFVNRETKEFVAFYAREGSV
jgi:hypothetical protein